MKKQSYKIDKYDWIVTVKKGKNIDYVFYKTYARAKSGARSFCKNQDVQIFKVSYEFRDAFVVNDPRAVKAKMKKNKK